MEKTERNTRLTWLLLLFISLIYFFANLQKLLVPGATFNELQQAFNADAAEVTRLASVFMYSYAFMQLVTGLLADRYSGIRIIAAGGLVLCIGSIMSSFDTSMPLLLFSRLLTGLGAATIYLSAVKEIARLLPDNLPIFSGILTIIGYSGGIVGTTPFIIGMNRYGYHTMMLWTGIVTAVFYVIYLAIAAASPKPAVNRTVTFSLNVYKSLLAVPYNRRQMMVSAMGFGMYFAIQTVIGKKFLEDYCHIESIRAGYVLTAMMLIAAVNGFIVALLSKCIGQRRRPFFLYSGFGNLIASAVLFLLVLFDGHSPWIAVPAMLFQTSACNISAMTVAGFREKNPENRFGTMMSISNFFSYFVTAVFGGCMGMLLDIYAPTMVDGIRVYGRNSYLMVFSVLIVLGALAAFNAWRLEESHQPDTSRSKR